MNLLTGLKWCMSRLCPATKQDVLRLEQIMASLSEQQAALTADLKAANAQLKKLIADTAGLQPAVNALKEQIAALELLVAAGGTISQELVDAVAETKSLTQAVDDNVPELPTPVA